MDDGLTVDKRVRDLDRRTPNRFGRIVTLYRRDVTVEWDPPTNPAPNHRRTTTVQRRTFLQRFEVLG